LNGHLVLAHRSIVSIGAVNSQGSDEEPVADSRHLETFGRNIGGEGAPVNLRIGHSAAAPEAQSVRSVR
jgi:hypothetical protein